METALNAVWDAAPRPAASTARAGGTPLGTGTTAPAGTRKRDWCG